MKWYWPLALSLALITGSCVTTAQGTNPSSDKQLTLQEVIQSSGTSIDESILENYPYKYSPIQRNGEQTPSQIKYQSAHPTDHIGYAGYAGMFSEALLGFLWIEV